MIKNPPMQEREVQSLGGEDPLEEEMAAHSSSCLQNPMDRGTWPATVHGVTEELDTAEPLSRPHRTGGLGRERRKREGL